MLQNGFVNWDDEANLLQNRNYRGLGWAQLRWMFTTFYGGHYQPLAWVSFGMDYLLWGTEPFGYHLTNLLFHAANAVLFYFFAREILVAALNQSASANSLLMMLAAGLSALLFAIHPLRVESVAWATERRDVLSGTFLLSCVLCYLRGVKYHPDPTPNSVDVCFGFVLWFVYPFQSDRGNAADSSPCSGYLSFETDPFESGKWPTTEIGKLLLEKIPFFVLAIGCCIDRAFSARRGDEVA